jgi:hypothetical protein
MAVGKREVISRLDCYCFRPGKAAAGQGTPTASSKIPTLDFSPVRALQKTLQICIVYITYLQRVH